MSGKGLMNQIMTVYFSYACQKPQDILINLSPPLGENTRGGSSSELHRFVGRNIMVRFFKPLPLVLLRFLHSGAHLISIHLYHLARIGSVEMTVMASGTIKN